jgi:anti-sigma factor (TIGR02949 family)
MKPVKTIGCNEALKHLLEYLDQELEGTKSQEVKQHIDLCRSCFSRAEFEQRLKDRLRQAGNESARGEFEKRIKTLLKKF